MIRTCSICPSSTHRAASCPKRSGKAAYEPQTFEDAYQQEAMAAMRERDRLSTTAKSL